MRIILIKYSLLLLCISYVYTAYSQTSYDSLIIQKNNFKSHTDTLELGMSEFVMSQRLIDSIELLNPDAGLVIINRYNNRINELYERFDVWVLRDFEGRNTLDKSLPRSYLYYNIVIKALMAFVVVLVCIAIFVFLKKNSN